MYCLDIAWTKKKLKNIRGREYNLLIVMCVTLLIPLSTSIFVVFPASLFVTLFANLPSILCTVLFVILFMICVDCNLKLRWTPEATTGVKLQSADKLAALATQSNRYVPLHSN
jgi:hypothetical protein